MYVRGECYRKKNHSRGEGTHKGAGACRDCHFQWAGSDKPYWERDMRENPWCLCEENSGHRGPKAECELFVAGWRGQGSRSCKEVHGEARSCGLSRPPWDGNPVPFLSAIASKSMVMSSFMHYLLQENHHLTSQCGSRWPNPAAEIF